MRAMRAEGFRGYGDLKRADIPSRAAATSNSQACIGGLATKRLARCTSSGE
jgi:hypothetical protein